MTPPAWSGRGLSAALAVPPPRAAAGAAGEGKGCQVARGCRPAAPGLPPPRVGGCLRTAALLLGYSSDTGVRSFLTTRHGYSLLCRHEPTLAVLGYIGSVRRGSHGVLTYAYMQLFALPGPSARRVCGLTHCGLRRTLRWRSYTRRVGLRLIGETLSAASLWRRHSTKQ